MCVILTSTGHHNVMELFGCLSCPSIQVYLLLNDYFKCRLNLVVFSPVNNQYIKV